jgi:hypothetical protein
MQPLVSRSIQPISIHFPTWVEWRSYLDRTAVGSARAAQQELGGPSQVVVGVRQGAQPHCYFEHGAVTIEGWIR